MTLPTFMYYILYLLAYHNGLVKESRVGSRSTKQIWVNILWMSVVFRGWIGLVRKRFPLMFLLVQSCSMLNCVQTRISWIKTHISIIRFLVVMFPTTRHASLNVKRAESPQLYQLWYLSGFCFDVNKVRNWYLKRSDCLAKKANCSRSGSVCCSSRRSKAVMLVVALG